MIKWHLNWSTLSAFNKFYFSLTSTPKCSFSTHCGDKVKILMDCFGKAWLEHFRDMQAQTVCTPPADLCSQKGVENPSLTSNNSSQQFQPTSAPTLSSTQKTHTVCKQWLIPKDEKGIIAVRIYKTWEETLPHSHNLVSYLSYFLHQLTQDTKFMQQLLEKTSLRSMFFPNSYPTMSKNDQEKLTRLCRKCVRHSKTRTSGVAPLHRVVQRTLTSRWL